MLGHRAAHRAVQLAGGLDALHCPGLASLRWVVKLYSLVLGGLGVILSFTWVCFHLYVLSMTSLMELRQHR